ncbi:glycosyltransferase family 4 protein [Emcibacter sp. SYSU 3D8]|uniref:glycosyltransferase family 4 protein n=1 Tax=Emcibacter sp. SYSU 3D8 TaxID=3133969 RepID=UPI0031FECF10
MIRHLLHVFPAFELGGAQIRTATWINGLGPAFRHSIISINGGLECRDRIDPALDVAYPPAPGTGLSLPSRLRAYRRFIRQAAPDVMVTNNWGSIEWTLAGRLAGAPRLLHVESGFGSDEASADYRRRALIRRKVLSGRVLTVVPSRTLMQRAQESWGLGAQRLRLVPDGIATGKFAAAAMGRARRPVPTIGTVAVLREEKRLDLLLDAFAALRAVMPARLIIAGDGAERVRLEAHAGQLGLGGDVEFTGMVEDVENIYPRLDIFALSSSTEQIPNAVLEAMAAGLAVAATAVGDVPAMVAAENAPFIVPPGDAAALAGAMEKLARDAALRERIGLANQRRASEVYDVAAMVAAYKALMDG